MNVIDGPGGRALVLLLVLAVVALAAVALRRRDAKARPVADGDVLTAADLGAELGERVTLLQVSARVCGQCATLRRVLTSLAEATPGVVHVEVLAEDRLDVVRRLGVVRTPTLLVLDGAGRVRSRATGVPPRGEIEASVRGVAAGSEEAA